MDHGSQLLPAERLHVPFDQREVEGTQPVEGGCFPRQEQVGRATTAQIKEGGSVHTVDLAMTQDQPTIRARDEVAQRIGILTPQRSIGSG